MALPTVITCLSDNETPSSLFYKVSAQEETAFLLESADGETRLSRFSIVGLMPRLTLQFKDGQGQIFRREDQSTQAVTIENPVALMQSLMAENASVFDGAQELPAIPFVGGWVGYMGYGATRYFDGIPQQADDPLDVPDGYYGLYDTFLVFDHLLRQLMFISYQPPHVANDVWKVVQERLAKAPALPPIYYATDLPEEDIFKGVSGPFTKESFCQMVRDAQEKIQEGQIFQMVVAQRFSLPINQEPFAIYRTLQMVNPSPYAYYLKYPGFSYLGSSPETFVSVRDGLVTLRALAGTRPRGKTEAEDLALAQELKANEKELAEHHMLVDLGRNDLGRISQVGSIRLGPIAEITRYTHVMHLATEITGQLRPDRTAYDVFKGCFPRGTVSGAPKIRAMQLLSQFEPERRGIYAGVVGYFDCLGNMDGAIAIRSALVKNHVAHVHAGAGVVMDSDPKGEYQETRNKSKSILKAIQMTERLAAHAHCYSG